MTKKPAETFEYRIGYEYQDETPERFYPVLVATVEVMAVGRNGGWGAPRATQNFECNILGHQRIDEFKRMVRERADWMRNRVAEAWDLVGKSPEISYTGEK